MTWSANEVEKAEFNQYWYSQKTLEAFRDEIDASPEGLKIAFLSTPSVYYMCNEETQKRSVLFDFDTRFEVNSNFVKFDFNAVDQIPENVRNSFDICVIDPPFITEDVWEKYGDACKALWKEDGAKRVFLTTVPENEVLLKRIFGPSLGSIKFRPSIPHLVYQYSAFTNYEPETPALKELNMEVDW